MAVLETTSMIGSILSSLATMTGSMYLGLFFLLLFFVTLCLAFRLPLELTIALIFPFVLVAATVTTEFITIFGLFAIYISAVMARWFFIQ